MNKKYYLRVEAVNLSNFIYDTKDLNTIRGGGLLLLDSIDKLKEKFNGKLKSIATGASSGLFELIVKDIDDAENIKRCIESYINNDNELKHATFVVDILESGESDTDFRTNREKLIALNRWRQMQSPSVAVPSRCSKYDRPCQIDMVRPATYKGDERLHISESVYNRRKYGKNKKQGFYKQFTGIELEYVNELGELTETKDESKDNLNHKMAVIYIDGNNFGKIQSDAKTQGELMCWDKTIKCYREDMLTKLLNEIKDKEEWKNGREIRLETLLWGGDEIMWVVPAWVGWWTLDFFYQQSKDWKFQDRPLKHAGGIVFCHHNAPIHRITDLARELAGLAKEKCRNKSLFAYLRLESFDHIGTKGIRDYIKDTYGSKIGYEDFVLDGEKMFEISENIKKLKESEFSKSLLYKIVKAIVSNDDIKDLVKKFAKKDIKEVLNDLNCLLNGEYAKWIHIAEILDYIV